MKLRSTNLILPVWGNAATIQWCRIAEDVSTNIDQHVWKQVMAVWDDINEVVTEYAGEQEHETNIHIST